MRHDKSVASLRDRKVPIFQLKRCHVSTRPVLLVNTIWQALKEQIIISVRYPEKLVEVLGQLTGQHGAVVLYHEAAYHPWQLFHQLSHPFRVQLLVCMKLAFELIRIPVRRNLGQRMSKEQWQTRVLVSGCEKCGLVGGGLRLSCLAGCPGFLEVGLQGGQPGSRLFQAPISRADSLRKMSSSSISVSRAWIRASTSSRSDGNYASSLSRSALKRWRSSFGSLSFASFTSVKAPAFTQSPQKLQLLRST